MRAKKLKAAAFILFLLYIFSAGLGISSAAQENKTENTAVPAISEDIEISSRRLELFGGRNEEKKTLAVGGGVFGLRIKEEGVSVIDTKRKGVLETGDRILKANGKAAYSCEVVEEAVKASHGAPIEFEILRKGERIKINVTPTLESGEYKLGATLRSTASGIGTITFYDPETKAFGGLGHGVCDSTGELIPIIDGMTTKVVLGGIKKGECGKPGELSGVLGKVNTGTIISNTECGIFGELDTFDLENAELYELCSKEDLKPGKAEIISTVKNGRCARYEIEIEDIDLENAGSKCFKIKVTDEALITLTGGIVRGMSGSPIIQNGKLVGAVTHVMVADPTEGYGIFIENMLNATNDANNSGQKAA